MRSQLTVKGRQLSVSNLDKVLYPKTGFTKGQVIDYYVKVSPVLLPHLKERPITLKRTRRAWKDFSFTRNSARPIARPG